MILIRRTVEGNSDTKAIRRSSGEKTGSDSLVSAAPGQLRRS
jgi:hypothetical protein